MFTDTHAHLNFKAFNKDLNQVIDKAINIGVKKIIIPGAKIDSSKKAVEISQKYPSCFAAVGIHPHHVESVIYNDTIEQLNLLANNPRVVAIGEIGLDYFRIYGNQPITNVIREKQKKIFLLQLKIAKRLNLPAIFHCRQAYDDLLEILTSFKQFNKKMPKGVFHCFSGKKKHLKTVIELGFFIGFDGNITYTENSHLRELVKSTPMDRLLLETDSPFLTPVTRNASGVRGQRNTPANLPLIARYVSKIIQKSTVELAKTTSFNAKKLFNF